LSPASPPQVKAAEVPEVPFRVAVTVAGAAVIHFRVVVHDVCVRGDGFLAVALAVGHRDAGTLRLATADFVGLGDVLAERVVAYLAEHHHAVAAGKLGMLDGAAFIFVNGMAAEAEGCATLVDGGMRIAITQAGNDGAAGVR
jgi:hypothetical protein